MNTENKNLKELSNEELRELIQIQGDEIRADIKKIKLGKRESISVKFMKLGFKLMLIGVVLMFVIGVVAVMCCAGG